VSNSPRPEVQLVELHRQYAALSVYDLWWRYFELGGTNTAPELDALLHGTVDPTAHEYNIIAVALNEYLMEFDPSRFVPYIEDGFVSN
jgi:hypothetical protein